jgi:alpha-2-macroglobulin
VNLRVEDTVVDLLPPLQGWAEGSDRTTIWVTGNPYAESLIHLRTLVNYPFG